MSSRRNFLRLAGGLSTVGLGSGIAAAGRPGTPGAQRGAADADLIAPLTHGESQNPDLQPTGATGFATFTHADDGTLEYRVTAKNVENVTQAHIHGPATRGERAGVVAFLLRFSATPAGPVEDARDGPVDVSGTVTDEALVQRILESPGNYYVNLHTVRNPAGEIRGQLR